MTIQEVGQIMDILNAFYPSFYAKQSEDEKYQASIMWASLFMDYPSKIVVAAVRAFVGADEKGFPPVPGQIMAKVRKITDPDEMTEADAWGLVRKAAGNSIYDSQKEFDKLPPILQSLVGSPNQLKEWAVMDSDEFQTVVASNFQRSYRARAASDREFQALPSDVKALAEELSERLTLKALVTQEQKDKTAREDMERMRRMMEQMKKSE